MAESSSIQPNVHVARVRALDAHERLLKIKMRIWGRFESSWERNNNLAFAPANWSRNQEKGVKEFFSSCVFLIVWQSSERTRLIVEVIRQGR